MDRFDPTQCARDMSTWLIQCIVQLPSNPHTSHPVISDSLCYPSHHNILFLSVIPFFTIFSSCDSFPSSPPLSRPPLPYPLPFPLTIFLLQMVFVLSL